MENSVFIRAIMAIGMTGEDFLLKVVNTIADEIDKKVYIIEFLDGVYLISIGEEYMIIDLIQIEERKSPDSPYELDRYILNELLEQGLKIDREESDYFKYLLKESI